MGGLADCTEAQKSKHEAKISGPLLERIDIQVEIPTVKFQDIVSKVYGECSERIRERVGRARQRQLERFAGRRIFANALTLAAQKEKTWEKSVELERLGGKLVALPLEEFKTLDEP